MQHDLVRLALSGFLLVTAACAPLPTPTRTPVSAPTIARPLPPAVTAPTPAADTVAPGAAIDALLQKLTRAGTFSGAVLVAENGQTLLRQGYGFADRERQIPNTPQTKFRIASITKQFTAMAILILQAQHKLTVQDRLCAYLTDCPESWKAITLHQLLTHTSGIPEAGALYELAGKLMAAARTKPLDFPPGSSWSYCNVGYDLLGAVIESVSGQTYEAFLQQNIFEPLQMSDTGYDHGQAQVALGYANLGSHPAAPIDPQALFAAAALYSTVDDLYRWDQALYTDKLVPQTSLAAMFTAQVVMPDSGGWSYGYGWTISPDKPRVIEHGGGVSGFRSVIRRYPDDQATIIVLINQADVSPQFTADLAAQKLFGK